MSVTENYRNILKELDLHAANHKVKPPQLVVVSKTFDAETIAPLITEGARVFGENRVQEAQGKWPGLREMADDIELHLIGPLQSNKTADAVELFDCIQTVDREKIARTISNEMQKQAKQLKLFVQVNTGSESQKAGVLPDVAAEFVEWCRNDEGLSIEGLMCIPPFDENPGPHFALLRKLADETGAKGLSMGMSADYLTAVEFGATHVRVGSGIFGARG
ncbi:MAG: YggS family pyridoxal phosphate-dependent enzyme [Pseudomonadota bacterium]